MMKEQDIGLNWWFQQLPKENWEDDMTEYFEAILVETKEQRDYLRQGEVISAEYSRGVMLEDEQARELAKDYDSVVIMFNGDIAGMKAATRAFLPLSRAGILPRVSYLPDGEDVISIVNKNNLLAIKRMAKESKDLLSEIIVMSYDHWNGEYEDAMRRFGKLLEMILSIPDDDIVIEYLNILVDKFGDSIKNGSASQPADIN
jgi:DNA primase